MLIPVSRGALGAAASLILSVPALAHVTLATRTSAPDAPYRAVLQINHGCAGAATTGITVTIPEGVVGVRPMPKPGWSLAIDKGAYAKSYRLYGADVSSGPKTITWSGGTLPDDQYDEFVFVGQMTDAFPVGAAVPFPVVQQCGATAARWTEVAAAGQDARGLKTPAPVVRIAAGPAAPDAGAMAGHDMSAHDMASHGATATGPAATPIKAGTLVIEAPWMRATPGGAKVAGGYLRVTNEGDAPDRLLAASIPIADRGEIHSMSMEGGVMKMAPVEGGLAIPPHGSVELKPGGFHVMFMDLRDGAKSGQTIAGTLTFERAGTVPVTFLVGGLGARSAPPAGN